MAANVDPALPPVRAGAEPVRRFDEPHRPAGVHENRMRPRLISEKPHAANQIAVGDAGRAEDHVVAAHEIVDLQNAIDIAKTHRDRAVGLVFDCAARAAP